MGVALAHYVTEISLKSVINCKLEVNMHTRYKYINTIMKDIASLKM